ncbi:MAG: helix-turn-helix domain-containing protein [Gordonibacter sp.]|nr:helix-turn-helix domain-containing protein [Gordonibacter sp.]
MSWPQSKTEPQTCRMVYLSEKPPADAPEMLAAEPELLTVQRMHELTGVSKQVIRKEIAEGRLPGCKIGRRFFVPKYKFIEYANGGITYE